MYHWIPNTFHSVLELYWSNKSRFKQKDLFPLPKTLSRNFVWRNFSLSISASAFLRLNQVWKAIVHSIPARISCISYCRFVARRRGRGWENKGRGWKSRRCRTCENERMKKKNIWPSLFLLLFFFGSLFGKELFFIYGWTFCVIFLRYGWDENGTMVTGWDWEIGHTRMFQ